MKKPKFATGDLVEVYQAGMLVCSSGRITEIAYNPIRYRILRVDHGGRFDTPWFEEGALKLLPKPDPAEIAKTQPGYPGGPSIDT